MFKVNNKNTRTTPGSILSIADLEHVNAGWVISFISQHLTAQS